MRGALCAYFAGTGRWNVRGSAACLDEARRLLTGSALLDIDVLLLDIELKTGGTADEWGLDIASMANLKARNCALVVYSNYDDAAHIQAALSAGARGFVSKARSERELEDALDAVLSGSVFIDERAVHNFTIYNDYLSRLTCRETEIFSLAQKGLTNKDIALQLSLSRRTVENILAIIYAKTGLSRVQIQKL
jgi:DNA-binding NarL/FixJ family response regulator